MDAKNHKPKRSKLFKGDSKLGIMDLPTVIMVEILSRLPIKSIFSCKTVCKLWYHLLTSDPLFANMYQTRSPNFPCILLSDDHYSISWLLELKADYDYDSIPDNRPIMLSSKFHLTRLKAPIYIVDSCNGFICLLNGDPYMENHSVYINNPLLGEYFKLGLPEWKKDIIHIDYGFCFSEASGQYKVLRLVLIAIKGSRRVSELEVYTLGVDEKWRNVGQVPCPKPLYASFGNVNVNGVVYWIGNSTKRICIHSFNVGTEEVKSLTAPPGLGTDSIRWTLTELGNRLCLADNRWNDYVEIWWMKEYSWTKDCILTDSILLNTPYSELKPIIIWKDGEILMQRHCGTELFSYNPKEKKFRKVNVYKCGTGATRYIPRFYSLKTVLGESFQVSNAYPKTEIV